MAWVIERTDGGRYYFSEKFGRDVGNPAGGWVRDIAEATPFLTKDAAEQRIAKLLFRYEAFGVTAREVPMPGHQSSAANAPQCIEASGKAQSEE